MDPVLRCKVLDCGNDSWTIIRYYLFNSSPSTQNIFENKFSNRDPGFRSECTPFWPSSESIASMDDITISADSWHEEGVDMHLPKERWDIWNRGRDMKVLCLANLTSMTSGDKLLNITPKRRPPKLQQ